MSAEGLHRPAWAEVSASAIAHNVQALKEIVGAASICAVVKANGYGHGAVLAARAALDGGADSLAVAIVDEGIELRDAGIRAPILLLAEVEPAVIPLALANALTLTIGSLQGARAAIACAEATGDVHPMHVKVDTGMHRMGVAPEDVDVIVDELRASGHVDLEGLYTHLAVADGSSDDDRAFTQTQIDRFDAVVAGLAERDVTVRVLHCANSAGAIGHPAARHSMVRVGLALYGYAPQPWLARVLGELGLSLEPALSLHARVTAVRRVAANGRPSYGRARALEYDATIATVPFGYADGYARHLFDTGAEVLIGAARHPLAGVVTMDQLLVDVGDELVEVGDAVVLLGVQGDERITADEWARRSETITWEVLCRLGSRVPRVLVD